ncbi:alpha/beta hydrolase [Bifidobacterium avesanii]|uniref:Phospholipase n=1 Tax=Bifidobacterium avesanii TaxID=1798157 RepID=A0A7K3TJI5_9BIFI|nr:dienelactone hydrolase family protein [Bifidobacterium avesanii]KAB8288125.1 phospholipase [Bifidobacterium avesanii]NEG79287.1 phospholipase [Bifidobacterium avesanii]
MEVTRAITQLNGPATRPVFLLLHGWGSNEYDLPDLLRYCAPNADFASLRAPLEYGMGYTWFGKWAHEGVPEGASLDDQAREAGEAVNRWVTANIPAERKVVPMGFSQGGLLAAHLLRLEPARYMAAVSFSGWLAPGPVTPGDEELARLKPPVFYGHGGADTIFPASDVAAMGAFWRGHGTLTEKVYPGMTHSISMDEMRDVSVFLQSIGAAVPQMW